MTTSRMLLAEFIGTFALMFVGGGAIIVSGGQDLVAIALAHGLILGVMVSAAMHTSGGQFNPAVAIALAVIGKQTWPRAGAFIVSQCLGAIAAAMLLKFTMSGTHEIGNIGATLGALTSGDKINLIGAFILEIIATYFLMFVIMGTAVDSTGVGKAMSVGGFGIGLTVAACILCIGPLTGASMNPARSLGPALVAKAWDAHWLYWLAPIIGATLAAVSYQATFMSGAAKK